MWLRIWTEDTIKAPRAWQRASLAAFISSIHPRPIVKDSCPISGKEFGRGDDVGNKESRERKQCTRKRFFRRNFNVFTRYVSRVTFERRTFSKTMEGS